MFSGKLSHEALVGTLARWKRFLDPIRALMMVGSLVGSGLVFWSLPTLPTNKMIIIGTGVVLLIVCCRTWGYCNGNEAALARILRSFEE